MGRVSRHKGKITNFFFNCAYRIDTVNLPDKKDSYGILMGRERGKNRIRMAFKPCFRRKRKRKEKTNK
jgi:hypothetical protein